jgi:hypothetical protein
MEVGLLLFLFLGLNLEFMKKKEEKQMHKICSINSVSDNEGKDGVR